VKLPRHNTVIAYLALFVALGGSAYAATQLPKNSVGSKQIKPNAVTAPKLKSGAVTGAKIGTNSVTGANIDESTLGRVPSATSAESATAAGHATSATNAAHAASATNATNAATAADAKALGGIPADDFLRANAVQFHTAALNVCLKLDLVDIPGWLEITTVGDCQNEFKFLVKNTSSEAWELLYGAGSASLSGGSSVNLDFPSTNHVDVFALSTTDPGKHAVIYCAYQAATVPPRISCSTRIPPAA